MLAVSLLQSFLLFPSVVFLFSPFTLWRPPEFTQMSFIHSSSSFIFAGVLSFVIDCHSSISIVYGSYLFFSFLLSVIFLTNTRASVLYIYIISPVLGEQVVFKLKTIESLSLSVQFITASINSKIIHCLDSSLDRYNVLFDIKQ